MPHLFYQPNGQTYTYQISATYAGGESDPSNEVSVTYDPIGIHDMQNAGIALYPNPLPQGQDISFNAEKEIVSTIIYDLSGRVVSQEKITRNRGVIPTAHLKEGIYLFKINTPESYVLKKNLIDAR